LFVKDTDILYYYAIHITMFGKSSGWVV